MCQPLVTHPGRGHHLPQEVTAWTIAFGSRLTWVQITALLLICCVILGWWFCLSEPQPLICNKSPLLLSGCTRVLERMFWGTSASCLPHGLPNTWRFLPFHGDPCGGD